MQVGWAVGLLKFHMQVDWGGRLSLVHFGLREPTR